jgi:hypothetical protein
MSRRPSMYAGTFCFLDYNTVARVNDDENIIETQDFSSRRWKCFSGALRGVRDPSGHVSNR